MVSVFTPRFGYAEYGVLTLSGLGGKGSSRGEKVLFLLIL